MKAALKQFLLGRKQAYARIFNPQTPDGNVVMKDLAKFCRANESCFHPDSRAHAVAEGRREVWLRIVKHTNLKDEDFLGIYEQ